MSPYDQVYTLTGRELRAVAEAWFSEVMEATYGERPWHFWPTALEAIEQAKTTLPKTSAG